MAKNKSRFIEDDYQFNCLMSWVHDGDLKMKVMGLMSEVWGVFRRIPASKSGKYHPVVCNYKPYGLLNHTLRVLWLARELCREEGLDHHETEEVMAASVIHDVGKTSYYDDNVEWTDHGVAGAKMAKKHGMDDNIVNMVARHMAHWGHKKLETVQDRILAYADYLASLTTVKITAIMMFDREGRSIYEIGGIVSKGGIKE